MQSDTTYILYVSDEDDTVKKEFLVQKNTDMIVFLPEEDVKPDKIDLDVIIGTALPTMATFNSATHSQETCYEEAAMWRAWAIK